MVLVDWAYTESGEILSAKELSKEHRGQAFSCVACGDPLIARVGDVNVPHFAHFIESTCSGESDLHKMAKELVARQFAGGRFEIEYEIELYCDRPRHRLEFKQVVDNWWDLTGHYHTAIVEGAYPDSGGPPLRADVLLLSDTKPTMAIEIFHTHAVDERKIELRIPIIQIPVDDIGDLEQLRAGRISYWHVHQFNFPERRRRRSCLCINGTDTEVKAMDDEMRALLPKPPVNNTARKEKRKKRYRPRYSRRSEAKFGYLNGYYSEEKYHEILADIEKKRR
jgi:Competence protein CoiA-like family